MDYSSVGFAKFIFGVLSQVNGLTLRTVADDAATILLPNGQTFTVTVTASRIKTIAPMTYTKPKVTKRGKEDA